MKPDQTRYHHAGIALLLSVPALLMTLGWRDARAIDFNAAVYKAQAYDPATQAAQYAYKAGLEKSKQGTALYLPQISLTGGYNQVHDNTVASLPPNFPPSVFAGSNSGGIYGYSVTLAQPLYRADVAASAAQLKDQTGLAEVQHQGADQNLILRVAQSYFGVLMAEDSLELTREQKAATVQQLDSAQARFNAGKANITDVRDAEARYQAIVAQEITAANDLTIQQDQFASLVGVPAEGLAKVPDTFKPAPPVPDVLSTWTDRGHTGNLDVQNAKIQLAINNEDIKKYQLRGRPQLNLVASYSDTRQNGDLPELAVPDQRSQSVIGLQLTVPLYTGGGYNSKLREAVAASEQARYQLQAATSNADVQIKQQFLNVSVGVPQIAALQQAVIAAKSSLDANILGRDVGTRTTQDVLNAQQQYFSSLLNLDAARYQYLLATLNLASLVGGLGSSDVNAVNAYLVDSTP